MFKTLAQLLAFASVLALASAAEPPTTESFPTANMVALEAGKFIVYWKYDTAGMFTFEAHVQTKGWVLFGFGDFKPVADIIVAWTNGDGTGHFTDANARDMAKLPTKDTKQDWMPLALNRVGDWTVLKFTRSAMVCDAT